MCRAYERVINLGYLDQDALQALDRIFTVFVGIHNKTEEAERREQERKNQLFKYKIQQHKIETEEEREERHFRELFPDFDGYLSDLRDVDVLDSQTQADPGEKQTADQKQNQTDGQTDEPLETVFEKLSPEDVNQLFRVHQLLFSNLSSLYSSNVTALWITPQDHLTTFQLCYSTAALLLKGKLIYSL